MAFGDYLTDAEWDACFYAFNGQHRAANFGESMHKTVNFLLAKGYRFPGLTETGGKAHQIGSNNPEKFCVVMGLKPEITTPEYFMEIFESGRNFLKQHAPEPVDETDEKWELQKSEAKAEGSPA